MLEGKKYLSWAHSSSSWAHYYYIQEVELIADAFIQSDLQRIQVIHFFVSMCDLWESNPQPLRC